MLYRFMVIAFIAAVALLTLSACPKPAADQTGATTAAPSGGPGAAPQGGAPGAPSGVVSAKDTPQKPPEGGAPPAKGGDSGKPGAKSTDNQITVDGEVKFLDVATKKIEVAYIKDGKAATQVCMLGATYDTCPTCGMKEKVALGVKGKFTLTLLPSGVYEFVGPACPKDDKSGCGGCDKDKGKEKDKGGATT